MLSGVEADPKSLIACVFRCLTSLRLRSGDTSEPSLDSVLELSAVRLSGVEAFLVPCDNILIYLT